MISDACKRNRSELKILQASAVRQRRLSCFLSGVGNIAMMRSYLVLNPLRSTSGFANAAGSGAAPASMSLFANRISLAIFAPRRYADCEGQPPDIVQQERDSMIRSIAALDDHRIRFWQPDGLQDMLVLVGPDKGRQPTGPERRGHHVLACNPALPGQQGSTLPAFFGGNPCQERVPHSNRQPRRHAGLMCAGASSVTIPFSTVKPASDASSVLGKEPAAATIRPAPGISPAWPSENRTPRFSCKP